MKQCIHKANQRGAKMGAALLALFLAFGLSTFGVDAQAEESVKNLEAKQWTVPDLGMEMVRIPAGEFTMGSPEDEEFRRGDETEHRVAISKPFYIGVYEVTQQQFYQLTMPDYDFESWIYFRGPITEGAAFHYRNQPPGVMHIKGNQLQPDFPMECVSWLRAVDYCEKLTGIEKKAGRLPEGYAYRLPTEAEWEYACRAGKAGPFNVDVDVETLKAEAEASEGDTEKEKTLNSFAFAWPVNPRWSKTDKVGNKRTPNAWGIYDMHGNVAEWTLDSYAAYPKAAKTTDPVVFTEDEEKIVRGGSIAGGFRFMRSAVRYSAPASADYYGFVGLRVVLAPEIEIPVTPAAEIVPEKTQ